MNTIWFLKKTKPSVSQCRMRKTSIAPVLADSEYVSAAFVQSTAATHNIQQANNNKRKMK